MTASDKRYVLLTGATGAIGGEIARRLAADGENIILMCRNEKKGQRLIDTLRGEYPAIDVRLLIADLAVSSSVIEAANTLRDLPLRGIIHNAGIMNRHYTVLPNGIETTLAVNYFNPVVLTELLLPNLEADAAIVFTTSITRKMWKSRLQKISDSHLENGIDGKNIHKIWIPRIEESEFSQLGTYGLSKRLVTDYAKTLARRLESRGIRVNCGDPGIVDTGMITMHRWYDHLADIIFRPLIRSPKSGAVPAVRAFRSPYTGRIYCKHAVHKNK